MNGKTQVAAQQASFSPPVNSGLLQRQCACGQHTIAGSQCGECGKTGGEVPDIVHDVLSSAGEPLDPQWRAFMEPRFGGDFARVPVRLSASPMRDLKLGAPGDFPETLADAAAGRALASEPSPTEAADFGHVLIHRDRRAAEAARLVGARAFTVGSHIIFGEGEYQPDSFSGRHLLAHELAHVVQQTGSTIRRKTGDNNAVADKPPATTSANERQPGDPPATPGNDPGKVADKVVAAPDNKPPEAATTDPAKEKQKDAKDDLQQKTADAAGKDKDKTADAQKQGDKAADAAKPAEPQTIGDLSTGDLALVDTELAEHLRWGAAAKMVGETGSAERAGFIAKKGADASSFGSSALQGAAMAAAIKTAEKLIGKVILKLAVKRLGAGAVKFTPVPGVGAMIGGAIAGYELATRDWKATGETIGKFGEGKSVYDTLANDIESISTVIDVATQVLNVIAGIIGAISFGMWAVTIVTVGVASPLAFTLSAIAGGIGLAAMILDGINALVLKELVTIFRILDTFTSEADPREVVTEGAAISQSAGAATGFIGGLAGAHAVEAGVKKFGPSGKKPPVSAPEHKTPPPAQGEGALVKADPPLDGFKPGTDTANATTETKASPTTESKPPVADTASSATPDSAAASPDVQSKPTEKPKTHAADKPHGTKAANATPDPVASPKDVASVPDNAPTADTAPTQAADTGGASPPSGPPSGGGEHGPPSGDPPAKKKSGPVDERSFADMNDIVSDMDQGPFGDKLQAGEARARIPPAKAPAGTRYGRRAYSMLRRALRMEQAGPPGTQAQHQTKWLASTRDIPVGDRMTPAQISENRMWLQTDPNRPATQLLADPQGGGTKYFIGDKPAPAPGGQLDLFSPNRQQAPQYTIEHRLMDNNLIPGAADHIRAQNPGGVDPNLVNLWAGADARWQTQGIPGQGDWSWQPGATGQAGVQQTLPGIKPSVSRPVAAPQVAPGQLPLPFDAPQANPNQLDLFGAKPPAGQPGAVAQPGPPLQPAPLDQPSAVAPVSGLPAPGSQPKIRIATNDAPAPDQKIRVAQPPVQDPEALRNAQSEQEMKEDDEAAQQTAKAPGRQIKVPTLPPGPGGPEKKDEAKPHEDPVVRHVNPHYAPPPCTPEQITEVEKDILQALAARAEAERISAAMKAQEKHHQDNQKPITDMSKATDDQISATDAHKLSVQRRDEANGKKKDNEEKVQGKLDHYSEEAGKMAAIKVPMSGFKRFTGLAYSLPDDPGILMRVKTNLIKMNKDTTNFLDQLDKMDEAVAAQNAGKGDRDKGIEADGKTLQETSQQADGSKDTFNQCKDTTADLDTENKSKLDDATKMRTDADQNANALSADAAQKKAKKESMAAALQEWAQNHRKARMDALEQTKKDLVDRGYKITGVKEL
jgi:hypothetical protein